MSLIDVLIALLGLSSEDESGLERENEDWRNAFMKKEVPPERDWQEDFARDPRDEVP